VSYLTLCIVKMSSSKIFGITDLVFHLSDFIDDSSAKEFFRSQRSFHGMIERYDGRYKVKKGLLLERVLEALEKWNAKPFIIRKNLLFIEYRYHDYLDVWTYRMEDGRLICGKNEAHPIKTPRAYDSDDDLKQKIENFLNC
jgi:hypothetical protein